ncbi:MAG: BON domain-containing protein [Planctomycetales bacterium]|nr:BON domain-containing protein [Planctomycetales bacterium]
MCDSWLIPDQLCEETIPMMTSTENKEIVTAASALLANSSVPELRTLRVDEDSNELQLRGNVRSFYHKQLAQEAVLPVAGRMRVVNHVDVSN